MKSFCILPIVLIFFVQFVRGDRIDFADCGSNAIIYEVNMEGCEEAPCEAQRGTTVRGYVLFESAVDTEYVDCELFGIIGGATLAFPGGCANVDACLDFSQGDCPVEAGEVIQYDIELKVLQSYPSGDVVGQWYLLTEEEDILICFEVDIIIT